MNALVLLVASLISSEEPVAEWPYRPPERQAPPRVADESWPLGDFDRYVLSRLENEDLEPAPEASRHELLRRVYLTLVGVPPSPRSMRDFVYDDSPDALAKVVDRLLASPRFGERWARHWMDVVRYAETAGHVTDRQRPNTWRYRDYLIDAFNTDLPYDRFVVEHIAGDLVAPPRPGLRGETNVAPAATGFLWFHEMHFRPIDPAGQRADQVDAQIDVIGKAFLGLTSACARCHDHKFDPISQRDYYALAGILHSTAQTHARLAPESGARGDSSAKAYAATRAKIEELIESQRRAVRARQSKKSGTPVAITEDNFDAGRRGELAKLRGRLAALDPSSALWTPSAMNTAARDVRLHSQGDHRRLGELVPRGFLSVLSKAPPPKFESESGRLWLAREIATERNALTARVIVNRLWQHHIGEGIVRTPSNFGRLGEPPTHRSLLDALAMRLVDAGWSLKAIHREIVLSATYRMSGRTSAEAKARDPENRLLHHREPKRLDAEAIRDSILAVSGSLDAAMDGAGVAPHVSPNATSNKPGNIPKSGPVDGRGRRSIYITVRRNFAPPFLATFDFPDPSSSVGRREITVGSAQSLAMLNSPFVHAESRRWAERAAKDEPDKSLLDTSAAMFERALSRPPTEPERRGLARFLERHVRITGSERVEVLTDVAHLLFSLPEFIQIR